MQNYNIDVNDYNSLSIHASVKIREAIHLASKGKITQSNVIGIVSSHLLEQIPRLSNISSAINLPIATLLSSVFVLPDHHPTSILSMDMNQLMKLPTYYDISSNLFSRLKHELKLRPPLLERMKSILADQKLAVTVIERCATKWSMHVLRFIIYRWRSELNLNHRLAKMGKYMMLMTTLKPSDVFAKWKRFSLESKKQKQKLSSVDYSALKQAKVQEAKVAAATITSLTRMNNLVKRTPRRFEGS